LLFGFLTLLELNSERKEWIAKEHAKELVETQAWAKLLLENASGGDEQADRMKMLAAAVVVKCGEVVERWRRLLLGDMVDI
jgi:telomere length regulation protein